MSAKIAPMEQNTGEGSSGGGGGGGEEATHSPLDALDDAVGAALDGLPAVHPPTGKPKKPKDLMDVFVVVKFAGEIGLGRRTATLMDAGRNHIVSPEQLPGQRLRMPAAAVRAGDAVITVFDDDVFSGDDLIGTWSGNLLDILRGDVELPPTRLQRRDDGSVALRLDLVWGGEGAVAKKAGKVDVELSWEGGAGAGSPPGSPGPARGGALVLQFKKFVSLRDVGAITNFANQVDLVPLYWSLGALVGYYVLGLLFYSLVPMALRGNTTEEVVVARTCDAGGTLVETVATVASSSPMDDMQASCDQSLNAGDGGAGDCSGFADALYFTTATLTTVGYGDMSPKYAGPGAVFFAAVFALVGVAFIGAALGVVAGFAMDRQEAAMAKLKAAGGPPKKSEQRKRCERQWRCCFSDNGQAVLKAVLALLVALATGMVFYYIELVHGQGVDPAALASGSNGTQAPESMFIKVLYFSTITSTTIGFGDEAPRTIAGRVVGSVYMLFAVSVFAYALAALADLPLSRRRHRMEAKVTTQYGSSLSPVELTNILRSANPHAVQDSELGSVSKAEFVVAMLQKLNKLRPDQIALIEEQFHRLDVDRSGTLTLADVTEVTPTFENLESSDSSDDGGGGL